MVQEVEERKRFLDEMTALGKRREYQQVIKNEIAEVSRTASIVARDRTFAFFQKVREMEQIDRQRSKALEQRLKEQN